MYSAVDYLYIEIAKLTWSNMIIIVPGNNVNGIDSGDNNDDDNNNDDNNAAAADDDDDDNNCNSNINCNRNGMYSVVDCMYFNSSPLVPHICVSGLGHHWFR